MLKKPRFEIKDIACGLLQHADTPEVVEMVIEDAEFTVYGLDRITGAYCVHNNKWRTNERPQVEWRRGWEPIRDVRHEVYTTSPDLAMEGV